MRIVFMGTPDFAVPSLKALCDNYEVKAVFTQPDKPKGRGKKMAFSPVKEEALRRGIAVFQPVKVRKEADVIDEIKKIDPDFIIVVAYGQILPKEVLDIPRFGCINLHASLLPKYRGAAPINWCIINGEKVTGNTTMLMDVGLDTGDILLKSEHEILDTMTAGDLHDILMEDGAKLLTETIEGVANNTIKPVKQDDSLSCYASMLSKELARIDWTKRALDINNLIRGLNPWPVAYTNYKGENMKVYQASYYGDSSSKKPGTILGASKQGIKVSTGEGILLIQKIQFPSGKPLMVEEYIKGNQIETETVLE